MDTTDQPNSICHVQPIQMYQLPSFETSLDFNFKLLAGEAVFHHGSSVDGFIVLTNYRLYLQVGENHHHVPLGLIEAVEHRELFYLHIGCKDARTYRCVFGNNENCLEWYDRIMKAAEPPKQQEQIFAFYHFIWAKDRGGMDVEERIKNLQYYTFDQKLFKEEMERLQFEGDSWRISESNKNYKLCPTYPPYLIVPSCINDETLECVAKFRSSRRIPAVVWRHTGNGAVIARSSQPEVGWLGWRSSEDEDLIKAISQACSFDQSMSSQSPGSINSEEDSSLHLTAADLGTVTEKKVLIMDARSYTTAVANRARGGGCECPEYYPNCEIQFMNLANIHSIRKSFHALRLLCTSSADQPNWFSQLEGTRWLQHMSGLMKAAVALVTAVERDARPVLVHCSDGWDRTPQIIALAELLLDPYYRTVDGFRILIEREWLAFGHKFADRCGQACGSDDQNERCPVFLQWLDCVHQLLVQYPCSFQFSQIYLIKLAQHVYSNLYGTFLCNTFQERMRIVNLKTFSVWEFLNCSRFKNHLYTPIGENSTYKVLWPHCNIRDLQLWREVYLGSWETNFSTTNNSSGDQQIGGATSSVGTTCPGIPPESSPSHMTKTRSYNDLINGPGDLCPSQLRRSSDPSINTEKTLSTVLPSTSQETNNGTLPNVAPSMNGHHNDDDDDDNNTTTTIACGDFLEPQPAEHCYVNSNGHVIENGDDKTDSGIFANGRTLKIDSEDDEDDDDDDEKSSPSLSATFSNFNLTQQQQNNFGQDPESDDNELTEEKSESRSENTICCFDITTTTTAGELLLNNGVSKSIETSTDTIVAENQNYSVVVMNDGTEKIQSPVGCVDATDGCKVCAQNLKFVNYSHSNYFCNKDVDRTSKYSSSPYSRTSSCSGWDNGLPQTQKITWQQQTCNTFRNLGEDGLVPVRSPAQERLWQLIQEHKKREELLQKELHSYRQALFNQFCHKCSNNFNEKIDETGSVVESICSAGEGQASAVESLRSDMSWEDLEDSSYAECTLWVPDHAVSRCTGCQTEFWVGKRKHHCRKCGRIFCASCSENSTPLPSEQLYNPVRVCTGCYSKLRRDCSELPEQCKRTNGQPQSSNPQQITASSN